MPVTLTPLPPHDTLAYFRQKGLSPSFAWQDVWQEEHAKAFTVAKAMSRDVLEDIRGAMDKALAEGQTLETFKANLTPILQAKGWWGRQTVTDPLTGKDVVAQLGSDKRLRTIFQTNLRTSYAVGNWQRAWATRQTFPYLQYQHNPDRYPRPQHVAWSGICLPVDDPWWDTHYPPCAWGCNCSTNSLSKRMLDQRNVEVTKRPIEFRKKTYINPRTGEISQIEEGIDPGWNFNVGKAPLRPVMPAPAAAGGAQAIGGTATVDQAELKAAKDAFLEEFNIPADDIAGKVIRDRDGWPLPIGDGLFRDAAGDLATPRPDMVDQLPKVAKALKSYDQVEWIWQPQTAGERTAERGIGTAIDDAGRPGDATRLVRFGKVDPWLADLAQTHGLKIDDFDHAIDGSAVRHMIKSHGSVSEGLRGQLPVTSADIRGLPNIVSAPDQVVFGMKSKFGADTIAFVARAQSGVYVYIAELRRGRWQLAAKTLWKYPDTADALDIAKRLVLHGQTDAGAAAMVADTTGKGKATAKWQLQSIVRRYTKRLDNQVITVDFSRGLWTFDIQPAPKP